MGSQNFYNPVENGHEIDARIVPDYSNQDPRQVYALLEDVYLHGGFRTCDTIQGSLPFPESFIDIPIPNYRNYITFDRRKLGMLVYTLDDGKFWQLINNPGFDPLYYDRDSTTLTKNSDWIELNINSSVFSAITYNNTTGALSILFSRTYVSGATYENSGITVTEITSGLTFINSRLSTLVDVNISNIQDKDILVYSASTQTWYSTGVTFGSGGTGTGTSGTSGTSGINGVLPIIGNQYEVVYRDTGITYGYNTDFGFQFDPFTQYLKVGPGTGATSRVEIYSIDGGNYIEDANISPGGEIFLNGLRTSDKSISFGQDGNKHFTLQTYREEDGDYFYVLNPQVNASPLTISRSGRVGVNKHFNVMNYHSHYVNNIDGILDDMSVTGYYDKLYQLLY